MMENRMLWPVYAYLVAVFLLWPDPWLVLFGACWYIHKRSAKELPPESLIASSFPRACATAFENGCAIGSQPSGRRSEPPSVACRLGGGRRAAFDKNPHAMGVEHRTGVSAAPVERACSLRAGAAQSCPASRCGYFRRQRETEPMPSRGKGTSTANFLLLICEPRFVGCAPFRLPEQSLMKLRLMQGLRRV
jgi:hypothetical protein